MEPRASDAELWRLLPGLRARLGDTEGARWAAAEWAHAGQMEHGSIASFAKFSLDLLALAAPPDLVEAAHRAAIDEIHHARIAWAISAALSGEPVGPGPLDVTAAVGPLLSVEHCLEETFVDGCVGETAAAARARVAREETANPALVAALDAIARDEASHADLAWSFVSWVVSSDVPSARGVLERACEAVRRGLDAKAREATATLTHFPGFGLLHPERAHAVERSTFDEVVVPAVEMLLRSQR